MKTVPLLLVVLIGIVGQGSVYSENIQRGKVRQNVAKENIPDGKLVQSAANDKFLYSYGPGQGDKKILIKDGGCSPPQRLQRQFMFFGVPYNNIYASRAGVQNGVISFNQPVVQFKPDAPRLTAEKVFFAPFWGEIKKSLGEEFYYRETNDLRVLKRITYNMNKHLPNPNFKAIWALIVAKVANYSSSGQMKKTFQAVLITDGHKYFLIVNVERTTDLDEGVPVQAGLHKGYYTHYFSPPLGPKTNKLLEITAKSIRNYPGRWITEVHDFKVPGGCIFEAKIAKEGEPFWKDSTCSTKCLCQNYNVNCVPEDCPTFSTCEVLGSFFTCKVKKETEPEPDPDPDPEPEPEPEAENTRG